MIKKVATFVGVFFDFFGRQNDYLYPASQDQIGYTPFEKPHLWKTRFGFKTSYNLANYIANAIHK